MVRVGGDEIVRAGARLDLGQQRRGLRVGDGGAQGERGHRDGDEQRDGEAAWGRGQPDARERE